MNWKKHNNKNSRRVTMGALAQSFSPKKSYHHLFPSQKKGLPVLDGIRAIGLMWVILAHVITSAAMLDTTVKKSEISLLGSLAENTPWYFDWIWNGDLMVDIFFILSGFLISGILFHEKDKTDSIRIGQFYYRRFMRLMPTYMFVAGLFFILNAPNREHLWKNLLYINNFFPNAEAAIPWSWSLAVEEQFYLIFPVFTLFILTRTQNPVRWLLLLLASSSVIRFTIVMLDDQLYGVQISNKLIDMDFQNHYLDVLYDNLYTRYGAFICGIGAQYLYHYHKTATTEFLNKNKLGGFLAIISMGLLVLQLQYNFLRGSVVLSDFSIISYHTLSRNIFSLSFSVFLLCMLTNTRSTSIASKFFSLKLWYPVAQLTYSAYLIHLPVIVGVLSLFLHSSRYFGFDCELDNFALLFPAFLASLLFTYLISTFIYFLIERPLMSYRDISSRVQSSPNPTIGVLATTR